MRQISDEEWEEIYLADKRQKEREERELFEAALVNGVDSPEAAGAMVFPSRKSVNSQRRINKAFSPEIDARLDLHLKTKDQSDRELCAFFRQASGAGDRTVLVITGKGHHSQTRGVLQEFVRQWLNGKGAEWILWFAEAPKNLGGSGAWLVRLKP